ncbi:MAG: hypothetical protein LKJ25_04490 [Clostridia bacterium]|jgi:hypothetical protein|nr:hypothetical protein [Clostridia bacterium]
MEIKNLSETVQLSIKKMNEMLNKKVLTPEEISTFKVLSNFVVTTIHLAELRNQYGAHVGPRQVYPQTSTKN